MDKVILMVELSAGTGDSSHCTVLSLPATDYEMLDALEKLQVQDDKGIEIEVFEYEHFGCLSPFLSEASLFDLNLLTRQLSKLDDTEAIAFEGLLTMETQKKKPFGLPKLIDLAYNAGRDVCDVYPGVRSDRELGKHFVENGLIKELEGIPDNIIDKLDLAKVGQEAREAEGGVFVFESHFVPGSYVIQHTELEPIYDSLPHAPQKPPYAILLELVKGSFDDAQLDNDKMFRLSLPASPQEMDAALDAVEAKGWQEMKFRCIDCCAPALIGSIGKDDNIAHINRLAQKLAGMEPKQLTKFKAVLSATQDYSILGATQIAYDLDQYLFTPKCTSSTDMALDFLRSSMGESAAEELRPFVNLYAYGQKLVEEQGCKLTGYGAVSKEEEPALTPTSPAPTRGGMAEQTM